MPSVEPPKPALPRRKSAIDPSPNAANAAGTAQASTPSTTATASAADRVVRRTTRTATGRLSTSGTTVSTPAVCAITPIAAAPTARPSSAGLLRRRAASSAATVSISAAATDASCRVPSPNGSHQARNSSAGTHQARGRVVVGRRAERTDAHVTSANASDGTRCSTGAAPSRPHSA